MNIMLAERSDRREQDTKELPEKITSVEQLFGTLPSDVDLDEVKKDRILKD